MYCTVATTSRSWCRRKCRRMCSMIGRPATGTRGLGRLLVSGRSREPSPPAMAELEQLAYQLHWTSQPRIEALFCALDRELWKSRREDPVVLLSQLGEAGVKKACERQDVQKALEGARQAYREYYNRHPRFM